MKQQVFYIHGGESFEHRDDFIERLKTIPLWYLPTNSQQATKKWTESLSGALGEDFDVVAPPMPNKQNAKFEEWKVWFERHFDYLEDGAILIGFSLGAMFLAKYLSNFDLPFKPRAVILMAGAYKLAGFSDISCGDFLISPEEVQKAQDRGLKIMIMHSKDDPVVPFLHGEALSKALPSAEFVVFEDRNHFLIEEFPELLEKIREL